MALVLRYSSVLQHDEVRGTRVRSSLRTCPEPRVTGPELVWDAPPLGLSGTWQAQCPPADASLLDGPEGAVRWHCLQPRARAELRLPDGRALSGLGYCELLTL